MAATGRMSLVLFNFLAIHMSSMLIQAFFPQSPWIAVAESKWNMMQLEARHKLSEEG